jgi:hypothetical protein
VGAAKVGQNRNTVAEAEQTNNRSGAEQAKTKQINAARMTI